jgi:RNA polymerase sigma-70 factor (ECF subfamily)
VAWSDGGGKTRAARRPIRGRDRISRFILGIYAKVRPAGDDELKLNGLPAAMLSRDIRRVLTVRVENGQISDIYLMVNPDKLRSVG